MRELRLQTERVETALTSTPVCEKRIEFDSHSSRLVSTLNVTVDSLVLKRRYATEMPTRNPHELLSHHSPQQHAKLECCPHAASKARIFLGVDWLFRCLVVYLRAFNKGSALGGGCCWRNLTHPLTSTEEERQKAPEGCTQS
ncbi:unnamed protein product [Pieris macdunnoughi]|uniref:Uncharacterized protein n=1 Tax=Pieris macdunnoughi TaxID=345717 RepID=A0A821WHN1_9NEOP|nr:unnamed protein product [Pieris macdunnoughi]